MTFGVYYCVFHGQAVPLRTGWRGQANSYTSVNAMTLCLSFKKGSLLSLLTDTYILCCLFLFHSFLFYCYLSSKGNWKKKSEKLCVVLCVWSAGSVQIAATFQKKAQLIYSRGVKEASSSRSNCPLLQIMQCSLNPLDITWKSILFAVFFNTTSPLDSRNNEWDVLAGIYRM